MGSEFVARLTTARSYLGVVMALSLFACAAHATAVLSTSFEIVPALPDFEDSNADPLVITGYTPVPANTFFELPGGVPLGIGVHNFEYPAARIGKFAFDPDDISSLFPIAGSNNGQTTTSIDLKMAITDFDTNPPDDVDFEDVIFALSLNDEDDGSGLLRILTDDDGGNPITPQFLTGFGNQPLGDPPDIATNSYALSGAPVLASALAEMFSASGGEVWLYIIDADDAGNNISLAQSSATDFTLTAAFEPVAVIPIPPAVVMFASAALALIVMVRRRV
jgi:hypothetical protein